MSDPCYICGQGSVGYMDTPGYNAPHHTLARCARHMPGWPRAEADQPDEKQRRVYYQNIVYAVCNELDRAYGLKVTKGQGVVCGTAEHPSTEVQDRLRELVDKHLARETA